MSKGFQGQKGQEIPEMTNDIVNKISERYIELYESITGETFIKSDLNNIHDRIEKNIKSWMKLY